MRRFWGGLIVGTLVGVLVLGAYLSPAPRMVATLLPTTAVLDPDEIAVGTVLLHAKDNTYVGAVVFAPNDAMRRLVERDVAQYRQPLPNTTPAGALPDVCPAGGCAAHVAGEATLLEDLKRNLTTILNGTGVRPSQDRVGAVEFFGKDGSLLLMSIYRAGDVRIASSDLRPAELPGILSALSSACSQAVNLTTNDARERDECFVRYVPFAVEADWDPRLSSYWKGAAPHLSVLGPLSYTSVEGAFTAKDASAASRDRMFVPNAALFAVGLAILVGMAIQESLERTRYKPFVPLPVITVLVGLAYLSWIHGVRADPGIVGRAFVLFPILFAVATGLFVLVAVPGHRLFSSGAAFLAMLLGFFTLLWKLGGIITEGPELLVSGLFDGSLPERARTSAGVAVFATIGVCAAVLLVSGALAGMTFVQGRRFATRSEIQEVVRRGPDREAAFLERLKEELATGEISRQAYGNVMARFIRAKRIEHWKLQGGAWWFRANRRVPFRHASTMQASAAGARTYEERLRASEKRLEDYWDRYQSAAEAARDVL